MSLTNFKNLGKKHQFYKIFTLIIVGLLVFYFTIYISISKINKTGEDIINQKIEIEKDNQEISNEGILNKKLNNIKPQLEKLNNIFLSSNRELEFVTTLEAVTERNSVDQKITLAEKKDNLGDGFQKSSLGLEVFGSFENLINYLKSIESLSYYININKLNITKSTNTKSYEKGLPGINDGSSGNNLSMKIEANIYWK